MAPSSCVNLCCHLVRDTIHVKAVIYRDVVQMANFGLVWFGLILFGLVVLNALATVRVISNPGRSGVKPNLKVS